jgi:hypothetical protein
MQYSNVHDKRNDQSHSSLICVSTCLLDNSPQSKQDRLSSSRQKQPKSPPMLPQLNTNTA